MLLHSPLRREWTEQRGGHNALQLAQLRRAADLTRRSSRADGYCHHSCVSNRPPSSPRWSSASPTIPTVRISTLTVFAILLLVLIGGLALNLTPCVLPMIPINLAIIGAGSQASSLVIRGMALEEFGVGDAVRILWREVRMGLVLGGILGTIGLLRAALVGHSGGGGMAAAVGLSLVACVTFGSVVGAGLPLLIKRIGFDPAVSSGPFIASLVDVIGIIIYLRIALFVLG